MSHYLFEIRRDNKVDGALAKLKFIKVIRIDGQGYKVGITKAGHEFAQLNNPYFDGIFESCGVKDYSNPELVKENTLSENEKSFLIPIFGERSIWRMFFEPNIRHSRRSA